MLSLSRGLTPNFMLGRSVCDAIAPAQFTACSLRCARRAAAKQIAIPQRGG
jgi:hypothetical protein